MRRERIHALFLNSLCFIKRACGLRNVNDVSYQRVHRGRSKSSGSDGSETTQVRPTQPLSHLIAETKLWLRMTSWTMELARHSICGISSEIEICQQTNAFPFLATRLHKLRAEALGRVALRCPGPPLPSGDGQRAIYARRDSIILTPMTVQAPAAQGP